MSRSRKRSKWFKVAPNPTRGAKKEANKKVRRTKDIINGNYYRRIYEQWDIMDYHYYFHGEYFWSNIYQEWRLIDPEWKARMK